MVWATLFAVGALLVGDAGTAGPLIAGHSSIGSLLGGVLLAVAGAASLWMCLRAAREAMGLLRMQLGGLLALSHRGSGGTDARHGAAVEPRRLAAALRRAGRAGDGRRRRRVRSRGRRPARRSCAAAARSATSAGTGARHRGRGRPSARQRLARHASALVGRSRAGAVAVRMAKAGTAGWYASPSRRAPHLRDPRGQHAGQPRRRRGPRRIRPRTTAAADRSRAAASAHRRARSERLSPSPDSAPGGRSVPRRLSHDVRRRDRPPGNPRSSDVATAAPPRSRRPAAAQVHRRRHGPATGPDGASDDADAPAAERPRALLRADLARLGRARGRRRRSSTARSGSRRLGCARP